MSDDPRRLIARALADHDQRDLGLDADRYPPERWLCCADAVLTALAAADGEPKCSECGGRPKRGLVKSEDGETWQCEGCYADLSRDPMPDVEPAKPDCDWFRWIGQPFYSCDACGRPAWEHKGYLWRRSDASPFDEDGDVEIEWTDEERESCRRKWEPAMLAARSARP